MGSTRHSTAKTLQVLFEDNHLIVVNKRPGDIVQGDKTGDTPLSEVVKQYIAIKYNKPGAVFLGQLTATVRLFSLDKNSTLSFTGSQPLRIQWFGVPYGLPLDKCNTFCAGERSGTLGSRARSERARCPRRRGRARAPRQTRGAPHVWRSVEPVKQLSSHVSFRETTPSLKGFREPGKATVHDSKKVNLMRATRQKKWQDLFSRKRVSDTMKQYIVQ